MLHFKEIEGVSNNPSYDLFIGRVVLGYTPGAGFHASVCEACDNASQISPEMERKTLQVKDEYSFSLVQFSDEDHLEVALLKGKEIYESFSDGAFSRGITYVDSLYELASLKERIKPLL